MAISWDTVATISVTQAISTTTTYLMIRLLTGVHSAVNGKKDGSKDKDKSDGIVPI